MQKIFLHIIFSIIIGRIHGQDIHFSMFDLAPIQMNAANTGNFDGDYRLAAIHRDQWRSVTVPFVTTGLSVDAKNPFTRLKNIHMGIFLLHDKTGDSEFSTFTFNPSIAYQRYVSSDSMQSISIGIQTGFTNRSINYSKLRFDEQYNGYIFDQNASSGETFGRDSRLYGDFNLGATYTLQIDAKKLVSAGISFNNILAPKQSFNDITNIKLDRRLVSTISGSFILGPKTTLLPAVLFMPQGKYKELSLGGNIKYNVQSTALRASAIYLGAWIRTRDAYYLTFGLDYKKIHGRISYDINFSNFTPATNRKGAFELGIVYIYKTLRPRNLKYKRCPDFM